MVCAGLFKILGAVTWMVFSKVSLFIFASSQFRPTYKQPPQNNCHHDATHNIITTNYSFSRLDLNWLPALPIWKTTTAASAPRYSLIFRQQKGALRMGVPDADEWISAPIGPPRNKRIGNLAFTCFRACLACWGAEFDSGHCSPVNGALCGRDTGVEFARTHRTITVKQFTCLIGSDVFNYHNWISLIGCD